MTAFRVPVMATAVVRLPTFLRCKTRSGGIAFILSGLLIALPGCGDGDDVATSTDANTDRAALPPGARIPMALPRSVATEAST